MSKLIHINQFGIAYNPDYDQNQPISLSQAFAFKCIQESDDIQQYGFELYYETKRNSYIFESTNCQFLHDATNILPIDSSYIDISHENKFVLKPIKRFSSKYTLSIDVAFIINTLDFLLMKGYLKDSTIRTIAVNYVRDQYDLRIQTQENYFQYIDYRLMSQESVFHSLLMQFPSIKELWKLANNEQDRLDNNISHPIQSITSDINDMKSMNRTNNNDYEQKMDINDSNIEMNVKESNIILDNDSIDQNHSYTNIPDNLSYSIKSSSTSLCNSQTICKENEFQTNLKSSDFHSDISSDILISSTCKNVMNTNNEYETKSCKEYKQQSQTDATITRDAAITADATITTNTINNIYTSATPNVNTVSSSDNKQVSNLQKRMNSNSSKNSDIKLPESLQTKDLKPSYSIQLSTNDIHISEMNETQNNKNNSDSIQKLIYKNESINHLNKQDNLIDENDYSIQNKNQSIDNPSMSQIESTRSRQEVPLNTTNYIEDMPINTNQNDNLLLKNGIHTNIVSEDSDSEVNLNVLDEIMNTYNIKLNTSINTSNIPDSENDNLPNHNLLSSINSKNIDKNKNDHYQEHLKFSQNSQNDTNYKNMKYYQNSENSSSSINSESTNNNEYTLLDARENKNDKVQTDIHKNQSYSDISDIPLFSKHITQVNDVSKNDITLESSSNASQNLKKNSIKQSIKRRRNKRIINETNKITLSSSISKPNYNKSINKYYVTQKNKIDKNNTVTLLYNKKIIKDVLSKEYIESRMNKMIDACPVLQATIGSNSLLSKRKLDTVSEMKNKQNKNNSNSESSDEEMNSQKVVSELSNDELNKKIQNNNQIYSILSDDSSDTQEIEKDVNNYNFIESNSANLHDNHYSVLSENDVALSISNPSNTITENNKNLCIHDTNMTISNSEHLSMNLDLSGNSQNDDNNDCNQVSNTITDMVDTSLTVLSSAHDTNYNIHTEVVVENNDTTKNDRISDVKINQDIKSPEISNSKEKDHDNHQENYDLERKKFQHYDNPISNINHNYHETQNGINSIDIVLNNIHSVVDTIDTLNNNNNMNQNIIDKETKERNDVDDDITQKSLKTKEVDSSNDKNYSNLNINNKSQYSIQENSLNINQNNENESLLSKSIPSDYELYTKGNIKSQTDSEYNSSKLDDISHSITTDDVNMNFLRNNNKKKSLLINLGMQDDHTYLYNPFNMCTNQLKNSTSNHCLFSENYCTNNYMDNQYTDIRLLHPKLIINNDIKQNYVDPTNTMSSIDSNNTLSNNNISIYSQNEHQNIISKYNYDSEMKTHDNLYSMNSSMNKTLPIHNNHEDSNLFIDNLNNSMSLLINTFSNDDKPMNNINKGTNKVIQKVIKTSKTSKTSKRTKASKTANITQSIKSNVSKPSVVHHVVKKKKVKRK